MKKSKRTKIKAVKKRVYRPRKPGTITPAPLAIVRAVRWGKAQTFWNEHNEDSVRMKMLRYLGATEQQVQELYSRDWAALSLWVRMKMKRLTEFQWLEIGDIAGIVSVQAGGTI